MPATSEIRRLRGDDLDRMVVIDRAHSGRSRRPFLGKRLAIGAIAPAEHLQFGVELDGRLAGLLLGRVQRGEFGRIDSSVVIDVIGVAAESRGRGCGRALLEAVSAEARSLGLPRLHSQAEWTMFGLLRFFAGTGFELSHRLVLERPVDRPFIEIGDEKRADEPTEVDYGRPPGPDYGPLARDRIPTRTMSNADLAAMAAIDREITGRDRSAYLAAKFAATLAGSDVGVSLVAELDGRVVGFVTARVGVGEFGRTEPAAELDTLGVSPECRSRGVGRALLSQLSANLASLRVERIATEVDWSDRDVLGFFGRYGFAPSRTLAFERELAGRR
ncbi:MAG TPA: GNAT family N-acetyltransferase [Steroidobacteraceae bacterium]|nr:GNAT family N-acetyltransferase [Steroidobacteraceae bacterium]